MTKANESTLREFYVTDYGRALILARINLINSLRWYSRGCGELAAEFLRCADYFATIANTRRPVERDYMADIANVDNALKGGAF